MPEMPTADVPVFCERCGYMLQGLEPQRCSACTMWGLRCPECGHQQHANSIRPALLRMLGRLRGAAVVLSWLIKLALCGGMAMAWWTAGMAWAYTIVQGRLSSNNEYILLLLFAVCSGWTVAAVLSHSVRWWLPGVVSLLLMAGPFWLGLQTWAADSWQAQQQGIKMPLLPADYVKHVLPWMAVGAFTGRWVLRLLVWAFWPIQVQRLLVAWYGSDRMPKLNLEAVSLPPRSPFAEETVLFCESCGSATHAVEPAACPACRLSHVTCGSCGGKQRVTPLRPVMQESVARSIAVVLSVVTLVQGGIMAGALIGWFVGGHESVTVYRYEPAPVANRTGVVKTPYTMMTGQVPMDWESVEAKICILLAAQFAVVARMMMLRWKHGMLVGLAVGVATAGVFAGGMICRFLEPNSPVAWFAPQTVAVLGMMVVAAMLAAGVAAPVWRLCVRAFLPKRLAEAVLRWQSGGRLAELIVIEGAPTKAKALVGQA
jgi:hypothetical protein